MTAPCGNCGTPRRRRPGGGLEGARDLCSACYRRSWRQGFPASVPEPRPQAERTDRFAGFRQAMAEQRASRIEDYRALRIRGLSRRRAAMILSVHPATTYRYEAELRGTRRSA